MVVSVVRVHLTGLAHTGLAHGGGLHLLLLYLLLLHLLLHLLLLVLFLLHLLHGGLAALLGVVIGLLELALLGGL